MSDEVLVRLRYEPRYVNPPMPAGPCHYGVVDWQKGMEVCRVWHEDDARRIADLLNDVRATTLRIAEMAERDAGAFDFTASKNSWGAAGLRIKADALRAFAKRLRDEPSAPVVESPDRREE